MFKHWLENHARWGVDEDGDVVLVLFRRLSIIRYKGRPLVCWGDHSANEGRESEQ